MDIYVAREDPSRGEWRHVAARSRSSRARRLRAVVVGDGGHLVDRARPGDIVLTLGAGDVTLLGPRCSSCSRERVRDDDA
jgi:UDP-N-acetylmuramate--alanine ligase